MVHLSSLYPLHSINDVMLQGGGGGGGVRMTNNVEGCIKKHDWGRGGGGGVEQGLFWL